MRIYSIFFCGLLLVAVLPWHAQAADAPEILPADVRLLIDVSGSMKRTDPKNLRKPALELLVRLLPQESQAGIWTFGTQVNPLSSHQAVSDSWRKQTLARTRLVNSADMRTHIGAALEQAAFDLATETTHPRHIILLTDGLVDIDTDASVNVSERARILSELLPLLQAAGYRLHTIALSEEADHDLMEKFAKATDGVYASVMNAEELMGVFLRIFDQAVHQPRLPLNKNRFLVDESVNEFTVLAFRKSGAAETELQAPSGNTFTRSDKAAGVNWYKSDAYDLVTVTDPQAGEWLLKAEQDPDNRVTVVSDLQLVVTPPKNNIEVSQSLDLHFVLRESGEVLRDPQFLQLLRLDVNVTRPADGRQWQTPIPNQVPPIDGVYSHALELFRETGHYRVQLLVDGKTFQREYSHRVTVGSPFTVDMERLLHKNRVAYRLRVSADDERVDLAQTSVVANLRNSQGGNALHTFEWLAEDGVWQLIIVPEVAARYSIGLQVSGQRKDGSQIRETLASRFFTYPDATDPVPDPMELSEEIITEEVHTHEQEILDEEEDLQVPAEGPAFVFEKADTSAAKKALLYSSVALVNILILVLAFFAYRMIMGKKARDEEEEIEETLGTDVQKIVENKKAPPPMQDLKPADSEPEWGVDLAEEDADTKISLDIPTLTNTETESSAATETAQQNAQESELSDLDAFLADADLSDFEDPQDKS